MKYTESDDGVERATLRLEVRLDREEVRQVKQLAKKAGSGSWREWLESHAALGIEEGLNQFDGAMEQRYGRGGD